VRLADAMNACKTGLTVQGRQSVYELALPVEKEARLRLGDDGLGFYGTTAAHPSSVDVAACSPLGPTSVRCPVMKATR
jgi:hypothetical protein